jgi:rRNA-processing protein FCF1
MMISFDIKLGSVTQHIFLIDYNFLNYALKQLVTIFKKWFHAFYGHYLKLILECYNHILETLLYKYMTHFKHD